MARRLMARIVKTRKALGLSQKAFAERAGLKYKHHQAVEAGRKEDFHFYTLEKMAKACGLELYELLNFDVEPMVLAEDPEKSGFQVTSTKGTRQPPKGSSRGRRGWVRQKHSIPEHFYPESLRDCLMQGGWAG